MLTMQVTQTLFILFTYCAAGNHDAVNHFLHVCCQISVVCGEQSEVSKDLQEWLTMWQ